MYVKTFGTVVNKAEDTKDMDDAASALVSSTNHAKSYLNKVEGIMKEQVLSKEQ